MKSGFVALVGRPNVGKSSLLNKILNYDLTITSSVPQTTRNQIKGIYNDKDSQIVFIDTPGIHKPQQKLGEILNKASYQALEDADLILFLTPLNEKMGPGDKLIISKIKKAKALKIALLSKLDLGDPQKAKEKAKELKDIGFTEVIGVSLKIPKSIEHLLSFLKENLSEGSPFYNEEDLSDISVRFLASEIIRETAIELTSEEIPHALSVEIRNFDEQEITTIEAIVYVEKESQKRILIGKNGQKIKEIGIKARGKIKERLDLTNNLFLKVKVAKNWTKDSKMLKKMGY